MHYKTKLGSTIHVKLLFPHAFTGCDTTSLIIEVGKATVFKKRIPKYFHEKALVFTASSR